VLIVLAEGSPRRASAGRGMSGRVPVYVPWLLAVAMHSLDPLTHMLPGTAALIAKDSINEQTPIAPLTQARDQVRKFSEQYFREKARATRDDIPRVDTAGTTQCSC